MVGLAALGACAEGTNLSPATATTAIESTEATTAEAPDDPPPAEPAPALLEPRIGATVRGTLEPGEAIVHTLHLAEDEYVEVYFSHTSDVARFRLYTPEDLADQPSVAIGWGEYHAEPRGQSLWGLSRGEGEYQLEIRAEADSEAKPYSVEILELHAIGEKELAKQAGEEAWEAALAALSKKNHEGTVLHLLDALRDWTKADYLRGVAASHERLGISLRKLNRLDEAAMHLRKAVRYWMEARDFEGVSLRLSNLAELEGDRGNWESAFELADRAASAARHGALEAAEGEALETSCSLHLARGETGQALTKCQQALDHWTQHDLLANAASTLNLLGLIHRQAGKLEEAGDFYRRALDILADHPSPAVEATIHRNLGVLRSSLNDLEGALHHYQVALDSYGPSEAPQQVAKTLYAIGTLHERTGNLDDTLLYYQRALEIQREQANPKDLVNTLYGIGWVHLQKGQLHSSRDYFEQALEIGLSSRSKTLIAWTLEGIADLQIAEGRPKEALDTIREALELQEDVRNRWEQARLRSHLSRAQLELGRPAEALVTLEQTAKLNLEIGNRRGLANNHYKMAQIHRDQGDLKAAERSITKALSIAEGIRHKIAGHDLRTLVGEKHQDYHEFWIDLLMQQHSLDPSAGYAAEALQAAERARAQSLLEVLAEANFEIEHSVPTALSAKRESIRRELVKVENNRALLLQKAEGDAEPAELFDLKVQLDHLLAGLTEVEHQMREASPSYAALTRPDAVSVGEIQSSLIDQDTALLEFRLGERRSFLFAVMPNGFRTFELPRRRDLEEDARCVHWLVTAFGKSASDEIADRPECLGTPEQGTETVSSRSPFKLRALRRQRIEQAFSERMARLSEKILGEASRAGVLNYSRLIVVADGALEYSPLTALPDPSDGEPLIVHHEIARLPSASFLAFYRRNGADATRPRRTLAIVADPVYGLADERLVGFDDFDRASEAELSRGRTYTRLPFASEEAHAIASFSPAEKTLVVLGQEATRDRVLGTALSDYRYIHFATHGEIDTHYPQLSSLALSVVDPTGTPTEDGFLRLHDIYEMELNAEMVVLSACETALGREIRGEGLVGLARGFMYAGAERVVASLWQVQDRATAELMEHFYRGLLDEGRSPADALRHAQLEMLSEPDGRYAFPYYWAGFVLQGEWR